MARKKKSASTPGTGEDLRTLRPFIVALRDDLRFLMEAGGDGPLAAAPKLLVDEIGGVLRKEGEVSRLWRYEKVMRAHRSEMTLGEAYLVLGQISVLLALPTPDEKDGGGQDGAEVLQLPLLTGLRGG